MSVEVECVARKWGSSIGVIIPKEVVESERIRPNEAIRVTVRKTPLAKMLWNLGPLPIKQSTQDIVDELKKGW